MKAIKINTPVNLTSGLSIPSGSVCIIAEGYADVKAVKDGFIPSQVATYVFASLDAILDGKSAILGIADFNTTFADLQLSVVDYETISAEQLLVGAVYGALEKIYPAQVEVISI